MKPKAPSEKHIALFQQANKLHQSGQLPEAVTIYKKLLQDFPKDSELLERIGTLTLMQGNPAQSVGFFQKSLQIAPRHALAHCNLGIALEQLNQPDRALVSYNQAISLKPDFAEAYINRGIVFYQQQRYDQALADYHQAIVLKPNNAMPYNHRGVVFLKLNQLPQALQDCQTAIVLSPNYAEAYFNLASVLQALNKPEQAIQSFDHAIALNPAYFAAYFNKANLLQDLKKPEQALQSYNMALSLNPLNVDTLINKGVVCQELNRVDEALNCFDQAISIDPQAVPAYINQASLLQNLKRFEESLQSFNKAYTLNPDYDFLLGQYLFNKLQICDWNNLRVLQAELMAKIAGGAKAGMPLHVLAFTDNLTLQHNAAANWFQDRFLQDQAAPGIHQYTDHSKIRIAYISEDFHYHPVSVLAAGLFESHDRDKFQIYAFSYGNKKDDLRKRLEAAFDEFIDIQNLSDQQVVELAVKMQIDIAVDLAGYTGDSRSGIFAKRAAPLQVSFLGYAGTLAAAYMDYIIADKVVIPEACQRQYLEKAIYLPDSFQVTDRSREISDQAFSRQQFALPEHGFVYCCFNNAYKINPDIFQCWMSILAEVAGSVLWLSGDNATASNNLKTAAEQFGIDPERLIFATRMELPEQHLARLKLADLFLDTFPYNAHATASDALWAGLPLLTYPGESYASRVSASLLSAIQLPELIAVSQAEYKSLAIELAVKPEKLADIKTRLAQNRLTTPLFDTQRYTIHLEAAYSRMHQRSLKGFAPDVIDLSIDD
jgi:predicted O-linked N-acetylglucosamine transferase (SPINDLY family)